jgi:hypothetical protein
MNLLDRHRKTDNLLQLVHHCWAIASGVQCDGSPLGCVSGYGASMSDESVSESEIDDEVSGRAGHRCQFRTT